MSQTSPGEAGVRQPPLHVVNDAAHVPALDENTDSGEPSSVFTADVHAAGDLFESGNLFERDVQAIWRIDQHFLQIGKAALAFRQTHYDAEMLLALPQFGRSLPRQPGLDDIFNISNVQSISRRAVPIDLD